MALTSDYTKLLHFDRSERINILILAFVFAFVLTLKSILENTTVGVYSMLFVFIGMVVVLFMHEGGHKLAAAIQGYSVRITRFTAGLLVSVFISMYTLGVIPIATPNTLEMDAHPTRRLRRYFKYESNYPQAIISFGGLLGSVIAIAFFKMLATLLGVTLFETIVVGAVLHAFYSLIPFELLKLLSLRFTTNPGTCSPGDGVHIFWWSHAAYIFALVFIIVYGLIAITTGVIAMGFSLFLAAISTWVYSRWVR